MEEKIKQLGPALLEAFQGIPDPRSPLGRRHPLPAILSLAVCAMLCNCHSLYAIHQWGREHAELAPRLGFKGTKTPATPTLHEVFKRLDRETFERALREWAKGNWATGRRRSPLMARACGGFMARSCPECIWRRYTRNNWA